MSDRRSREEVRTVKLSADDIIQPSWPIALAMLERMSPQAVFALRLGFIEQLHRLLDEMSHADAKADLVDKVRWIVEVLARLPW